MFVRWIDLTISPSRCPGSLWGFAKYLHYFYRRFVVSSFTLVDQWVRKSKCAALCVGEGVNKVEALLYAAKARGAGGKNAPFL